MGRKGVSADEKRQRMLDFFYETEDVFALKNVEKRVSKEKGITSMAIKDVLQSLVDDGLVHCEKIGTSNYYWAFPSEGASLRQAKKKDLDEKIAALKQKKEDLQARIAEARTTRQETPKRAKLLEELEEERQKEANLDAELKVYADCDPEMLEGRKQDTKKAKEAANRWTDNVFAIRSWCQRKFAIDLKMLDKQFGVPEDLDYVE
eukprot:m.156134 g.156134  ORF g.156134 m.156134 type:complete len:205 (-) comp16289_c2_seq1:174-788(-)